MKLLIVGSWGTLLDSLTATCRKANWEVYMLVGRTGSLQKPSRVFEQFVFPYTSDAIPQVLDTVSPDAVLFTGPFDQCFPWTQEETAVMDYAAALMGILDACDHHPGLKFFYLSNEEVFQPDAGDRAEEDATLPAGLRGLAIAQGEQMCLERSRTRGLDVTIIRLDHLCPLRRETEEYCAPLPALVHQMLAGGVSAQAIPDGSHFPLLHTGDAAEGLWRIMAAEARKASIYHLSAEELTCWNSLLTKSAELLGVEAPHALISSGGFRRLTAERARQEFGFSVRHSVTELLTTTCQQEKRYLKRFLTDGEKQALESADTPRAKFKKFMHHLTPFLWNGVVAALCVVGDTLLTRSGYGGKLDLLLLYPLAVSGLFGKRQAVLSAAVSVVWFFLRSGDIFSSMIDYNTYLWVAQVFIAAMLVGHLRDSMETIKIETEEESNALRTRLRELSSINETNVRIKQVYERRLIDYNGSLGRIYKVTSQLSSMEPGQVLFAASRVIGDVMATRDVAIYTVTSDSYCRLFSATSVKARSLGRSLRYPALEEMYRAVMDHKVYINRQLDPTLPLMANGIFEGEKLTFLIFLWGLPLENMTLYQSNQLSVLCYLIMMSLNRAQTYLQALERDRFLEGTRLMDEEAFGEMLSMYRYAAEQHLAEYVLLRVDHGGLALDQVSTLMQKATRTTDLCGVNEEGVVHLLLPNTSRQDVPIVQARLQGIGLDCTIAEEAGA